MNIFLSKKITRVSFILSICIILYHATNVITYYLGTYNPVMLLENYLYSLLDFATPTFFIISGFLFYINCESIFKVLNKAKKRVFTLLIPYFIFCAIYTIYFLAIYNIPGIKDKLNNSYKEPLNLTNVINGLIFAKYGGILWYVRNLIILTILSPIIYYSLKIKPISFIVLAGLFSLYLFDLEPSFTPYLQTASWFWYYLGGVIAFNLKPIGKLKTKYSLIFLICGLLLAGLRLFLKGGCGNLNINATLDKILIKLLLPIMIVCFWFAFDLVVSEKTIRIEKISFFIYCTHSLILETIQKIIFIVGQRNSFFAFIDYFGSTALTFAIIIALAFILNKYFPKVFYIISGGRILPPKQNDQSETTSQENN